MKKYLFLMGISAASMAQAQNVAPEDKGDARGSDIVVTATRSEQRIVDVPAAISVASFDDLRLQGFVTGTDEYRGVPGVFFRRGEGDNDEFPFVSFRGSTGTDGSLSLIDGIPIVGPYEETQLYDLPYDAFERVEILRGPGSSLYGRGALYGSTNYLTRSARQDSLRAAISTGSDNFYRGELSLSRRIGDNAGVLLSGVYEDNGGWREQDGRRVWNLFGKVEADIGPRTNLTAFLTYNDRLTHPANAIPLDAQGNVVAVAGGRRGFIGFGEPFNDTESLFGVGRLTHQFSDSLTATVTIHGRRNRRDTFLNFFDSFALDVDNGIIGFSGFRGATRQNAWFGEGTLRWESGAHNLIVGIGGERSTVRSSERWTGQNGFTFECGFAFYSILVDFRSGQTLNADHPCFVRDELLSRSNFLNTFWGAFIQDEFALGDRWQLTVGGRYDSFRRRSDFDDLSGGGAGGRLVGKADAFSPRVALSYRSEWGQIYASYSRGFNSNFGPTFEWDPFQYARPENRPTTLDSYEVGAKGEALNGTLTFELAAYHTRQRNRRISDFNPAAETDPTAPPNLVTFGNLYDVWGAEATLNIRPRDGTDIRISYSHVAPEWQDYELGGIDLSGRTPTGVSRNMVYLSGNQRVGEAVTLRAAYEWYDDYFITQSNNFEGGGYDLLTLGASIAPPSWRGVAMDLVVTNVLDREYYFFFGGRTFQATHATPGPPRQFRVTVRGSF